MAKKKTVRKVRTPAGVKRFGAPIGTPIIADPVTGKLKAVKGLARLDGKPVSKPKTSLAGRKDPVVPKPKPKTKPKTTPSVKAKAKAKADLETPRRNRKDRANAQAMRNRVAKIERDKAERAKAADATPEKPETKKPEPKKPERTPQNLKAKSRTEKKALKTTPKPRSGGTPEQRGKGVKPAASRTAEKAAKEARSRLTAKEQRMNVSDKTGTPKERLDRARVVRGPGPWDPEDNFEKRGEWVDKIIGRMMKSGKTTDVVHKRVTYDAEGNRDSQWNPDRAKLHKELLDEAWKRGNADNVPRERKAAFTGGAGGSGKGFVLKTAGIKEGEDYVTVNADDFKELLAERGLIPVPEGMAQMEGVALVHEESSYLASQFAARLQAQGINMIWDITMGNAGQVEKRLDLLEKNGYKEIRGMYVDVPIERSVENARSRYANGMKRLANGTETKGGRRVPPKVILENATDTPGVTKNKLAFESIRGRFTVAEVWDNNRRDKNGKPLPPIVVG